MMPESSHWSPRPQVGRFYGDFLCMGSMLQKKGPPRKGRRKPESPLNSRIWSWFGDARLARRELESLTNRCGR